jgi:Domain of unknown function (DUF4431)
MKIRILRTLVALGTYFVSSIASAEQCLQYEPVTVAIQGSVSLIPAYGPPGFGENPRHDAHEDYLALTLNTSMCVTASSKPQTENVAEGDIKTVQLVFRNSEAFQRAKLWIGKKISVTGSLYHGFTGHHHTTVLLKVNTGQAAEPR